MVRKVTVESQDEPRVHEAVALCRPSLLTINLLTPGGRVLVRECSHKEQENIGHPSHLEIKEGSKEDIGHTGH